MTKVTKEWLQGELEDVKEEIQKLRMEYLSNLGHWSEEEGRLKKEAAAAQAALERVREAIRELDSAEKSWDAHGYGRKTVLEPDGLAIRLRDAQANLRAAHDATANPHEALRADRERVVRKAWGVAAGGTSPTVEQTISAVLGPKPDAPEVDS